jgi:signal transduction histidine kinase/CheY-like chemotaxis protein
MKKYIIYAFVLYLILCSLILYSFWRIYIRQVAFQQEILQKQVENCGDEVEKQIVRFSNEVNFLLFSENLTGIIGSEVYKNNILSKIEMLYASYNTLIRNIYIYDQNRNVVNIYYDKKGSLIIDPYSAQRQKALTEKETVIKTADLYQCSMPVFHENTLAGNMVLTLDLKRYIQTHAEKYQLSGILWQWITDEDGTLLYSSENQKVEFQNFEIIQADLKAGLSGSYKHKILINNNSKSFISSYYSLDLLTHRLGLVFSLDNSAFTSYLIKTFTITILVLIVLLFIIIFMLRLIHNSQKNEKRLISDFQNLQSIIESLPLGILVSDANKYVKLMNRTAREMLMLKEAANIRLSDIMNRFILMKEYYEDGKEIAAFDSNQFVLYKNEGEEVVVYKRDIPHVIENEELVLSAFVDITSIEKSRKYEAASNTAKSAFLAKMSHEIRTPMNGIIGMTEALNKENLKKDQKEYVEIVRKSADLLLNLIDDLLDFSKIEAGKMQIEEIPFKLRDELKISLDLFRPIVEEKSLKLVLKIEPEVPQNVIGDPFRLRQVLTNLISNAVKFTHEGEILVGVKLEEEYNGNLTLLFYIEDTGIGIPNHKIESIFNSFTQADESTSRKYGGSGLGTTISKQLVTLMNGEIWVESPSSISTNPNFPGSKFCFTIEVFSNERLIKNVKTDHITNFNQINSIIITQRIDIKSRLDRFLDSKDIHYSIYEYKEEHYNSLIKTLQDATPETFLLFIIDDYSLDGMSLAKRLRDEKFLDAFIVITISSNHKAENFVLSKRYGIDSYFIEPFEYNDLSAFIYETFHQIKKEPHEDEKKLRNDISILVAEDNIINQKVATAIFGNMGLSIDIAQDGNEVLDKVKSKCYDIIFMDLMMPLRDGIQTTVEIRSLGYQMPIIAMTATISSSSKSKALASGLNDYITKPVKPDTVRNILYKWFA